MAYAMTAAEIPDAYTGNATEIWTSGGQKLLVQDTVAATESTLKAATGSSSLANFSELEQTWILSAPDGDYGFKYWRALAPVRVTPAQVIFIRRLQTAPVQVATSTPPPF